MNRIAKANTEGNVVEQEKGEKEQRKKTYTKEKNNTATNIR